MKRLCLLMLFYVPSSVFAQVIRDESKNGEVQVFQYEKDGSKPSADDNKKNVVKMSLFHIVDGRFIGFYERKLTNSLSVEGGLGFTLGDFRSIILDDDVYSYNSEKSTGFGKTLEISSKFYPSAWALEETYLSFNARYADYPVSYTYINPNYTLNANDQKFEFLFTIGYQGTDWSDALAVDYYFGFGVSHRKMHDLSNANGNYTLQYQATNLPMIRLGLKIGFQL